MRAGLTRDEAMWKSPYAEILQFVHVEMMANGATPRWVRRGNDTTINIAAIKARKFDLSWQ